MNHWRRLTSRQLDGVRSILDLTGRSVVAHGGLAAVLDLVECVRAKVGGTTLAEMASVAGRRRFAAAASGLIFRIFRKGAGRTRGDGEMTCKAIPPWGRSSCRPETCRARRGGHGWGARVNLRARGWSPWRRSRSGVGVGLLRWGCADGVLLLSCAALGFSCRGYEGLNG